MYKVTVMPLSGLTEKNHASLSGEPDFGLKFGPMISHVRRRNVNSIERFKQTSHATDTASCLLLSHCVNEYIYCEH